MTGSALAMSGSAVLWAVVGLPAVVGALLGLTRPRSRRVAAGVAVPTAGALVVLAVIGLRTAPEVAAPFVLGVEFGLAVDPLAGVVLVTVAAVGLLVLVFAAADVDEAPGRFFGLMLLFVAAVAATVTATTLPTLLVAWELMGATSYALIGFSWRQPGKLEAGAVAFLTTRAADLGLYVAAGAALAAGSGLRLTDLAAAGPGWRDVIAVGLVVAALGKAAQLPFSFWLSNAMEGPSPVSALLHSAAMVAMGGYLLLRVEPLLAATGDVAAAVAWLGALTTVLLGAVAVAQRDLKQLLAASTAAQLGFVVLAAGVGGVTAGTTQLVAHAATKALLFLAAGAWLSALGTKQLAALRGVARRWPAVGVLATVGLLALAGVAPLSLWASKEAVLAVALEGSTALFAVGLLGSILSAAYAGRALAVLWAPIPADVGRRFDTEQTGDRTIRRPTRPVLAVLAVGAAGLGVLTVPAVSAPLHRWLGDPTTATASPVELVGSAVLALAVAGAAWRWSPPAPRWALDWLWLEPGVRLVLVRPTDQLARALARFDDRVLDRGVEAVAHGTLRVGRALARVDDHGIDAAVAATARGVRRLGQAARRPQTGQLYQYYLQSAVVLIGAVVLLVLVR